jgi:hypothetical protein
VGAAERGRTSGLAPRSPRHPKQEQSSIGCSGGIKAAKAHAWFIINNFYSARLGFELVRNAAIRSAATVRPGLELDGNEVKRHSPRQDSSGHSQSILHECFEVASCLPGIMRPVRARACERVMGSYWDAMTTSSAAKSDRSRWCRRRSQTPSACANGDKAVRPSSVMSCWRHLRGRRKRLPIGGAAAANVGEAAGNAAGNIMTGKSEFRLPDNIVVGPDPNYWQVLGQFIEAFSTCEGVVFSVLTFCADVSIPVAKALFARTRIDAAIDYMNRIAEARSLAPLAESFYRACGGKVSRSRAPIPDFKGRPRSSHAARPSNTRH